MKLQNLLVLPLVLLFACQGNKISKNAERVFNEKYPDATNVEWFNNGAEGFNVMFKLNDQDVFADFDASANWVLTTFSMDIASVPKKMQNYVYVFYPSIEVKYERIDMTERIVYKAYYEIEDEINELVFDEFGLLIDDPQNQIINKFKLKYPEASEVDWELVKNGNYLAVFEQDETHWKATFLKDGNWICSKTSLTLEDMPDKVCDYLMRIKNFEVSEYKEKTNTEGTKYLVDGQIKNTPVSFVFDKEGNLIEKVNLDYK